MPSATRPAPIFGAIVGPFQKAYMTWLDASGAPNGLTFDVVVSEDWDEDATVTEHPVEQGPDVSDHIRVALPTCRLRIFSTNEPIDVAAGDSTDVASPGQIDIPIPSVVYTRGTGVSVADFLGIENAGGPTQTGSIIAFPDWVNPITARALAISAAGAGAGAIAAATGNGQDKFAGLAEAGAVIAAEALANLFLGAKEQTLYQMTDAGLLPVLNQPAQATVQVWPSGQDYVYALHQLLRSLKSAATLFTVTGTKEGPVPSMVIEHLSFHRDAGTGTGEEITIGLKQILIVTTQTVAVQPISNLSGGGGVDSAALGAQTATPAKNSVALEYATNNGVLGAGRGP